MERSLSKKPEQKQQYYDFLKEYETLGHMTACKEVNKDGFYLPHHAVFKTSSLTTKLRVVFDASANSSSGISLNDTLMAGPKIQDDLFIIILRGRLPTHIITADIEKMYRQILVAEDDKIYQKILWRKSQSEQIKAFKLNTLTYGTKPASFIATGTLKKLANDEQHRFPMAARAIRENCYVDNIFAGKDTYEDAKDLINELISICTASGMNLRQWASNEPSLIKHLNNRPDDMLICLNPDETVKTLGLNWNAQNDTIIYSISIDNVKTISKRSILSQIARLFDPLGLLGPVIVKAKMIMQKLWQIQIDWDESLPLELHTQWQDYQTKLPALQDITFDRKTLLENPTQIQIHGFCDASERAYGACIYIRSSNENKTLSKLMCAKSRVAPLKSITIPRLELCAANLLIKLLNETRKAINNLHIDKIFLWSDSTIVLHWINSPPHTLKTFVQNRVAEIQGFSEPHEWLHVRSEDNPADILSRGAMPDEFSQNIQLWENGPSWLQLSQSSWPIQPLHKIIVPEIKEIKCFITQNANDQAENLIKKFSSFFKLKRVIAYCLRFIKNTIAKITKNFNAIMTSKNLTTQELQYAHQKIILIAQSKPFANDIKSLKANQAIKGRLIALNPFLDSDGIIRVGGRLRLADLPYSQKHPILLPANNHLTRLIIQDTHLKLLHAGAQSTLCATRQSYWIINGLNTVKNILNKCTPCFRAKPNTPDYLMGDLPKNRVKYTRRFLQAGVDFCSPFLIKEKRHRNRGKLKVYIAIFVCFSTRAVHIEIVEDLTIEAFLACLKRFVSRRGRPSDIFSDNATNFAGANRELEQLYKILNNNLSQLQHSILNDNIKWHFIPPRSPHFGGLWEAAVKSFKRHMTRVVGNTILSYEALHTLTTEIEAILNSRPLCPLSSDPNDLQVLTPGHFLIGDSLMHIPENDFSNIPTARLSSWQHAQQIKQHFWSRWRKEYLHQQTVRVKWHTNAIKDIAIGTIVIVHEDNVPPIQWKLGRIINTHPGQDGVIRVATVKTAAGEYKRSIKRLSPLPFQRDDYNFN